MQLPHFKSLNLKMLTQELRFGPWLNAWMLTFLNQNQILLPPSAHTLHTEREEREEAAMEGALSVLSKINVHYGNKHAQGRKKHCMPVSL